MTKTVTIGLVGAGRASQIHYDGYQTVRGVNVRLKTIAAAPNDIKQLTAAKERYGFEQMTTDYHDMLEDPEIDVIDIVVPPVLHVKIIEEALAAGKNVFCEKPLTGYFGKPGDPQSIGEVSRKKMYETLCEEVRPLEEMVINSGKVFAYCENWTYAPMIVRAADLIRKRKSRILYMHGEESAPGSPSPTAGIWKYSGGGPFARMATHPLSAALWLKQQEADTFGTVIRPVSVYAETSRVLPGLSDHEKRCFKGTHEDVEDIAAALIKFSDGSVANIVANDCWTAGLRDNLDIYCNDTSYRLKLNDYDLIRAYMRDDEGVENEKLYTAMPSILGWNNVEILTSETHGYTSELSDMLLAVAEGRPASCGIRIAVDTAKIIYAAYYSAEIGQRVEL